MISKYPQGIGYSNPWKKGEDAFDYWFGKLSLILRTHMK